MSHIPGFRSSMSQLHCKNIDKNHTFLILPLLFRLLFLLLLLFLHFLLFCLLPFCLSSQSCHLFAVPRSHQHLPGDHLEQPGGLRL